MQGGRRVGVSCWFECFLNPRTLCSLNWLYFASLHHFSLSHSVWNSYWCFIFYKIQESHKISNLAIKIQQTWQALVFATLNFFGRLTWLTSAVFFIINSEIVLALWNSCLSYLIQYFCRGTIKSFVPYIPRVIHELRVVRMYLKPLE